MPRQYLGRQCMALDKREQRRRKREAAGKASGNGVGDGAVTTASAIRATAGATQKGGLGNGPAILPAWILEEPARFVPYRDGTPREAWYPAFLEHYATHGGKSLAASAAGVTLKTVNRCLAADATFAEELGAARSYHGELIEWESLCVGRRKGNPLPYFDRLKAELPERHLDQLRVSSVNVNLDAATLLGENEYTAALALFTALAGLADTFRSPRQLEARRDEVPGDVIDTTAQVVDRTIMGRPGAGSTVVPDGASG